MTFARREPTHIGLIVYRNTFLSMNNTCDFPVFLPLAQVGADALVAQAGQFLKASASFALGQVLSALWGFPCGQASWRLFLFGILCLLLFANCKGIVCFFKAGGGSSCSVSLGGEERERLARIFAKL